MQSIINTRNLQTGGVFYLISVSCLLIPLCVFSSIIGEAQTARFARFIFILGIESLFIMSPIWIAGRRWRFMACFVVAFISFFCWTNTLYYRYWQDIIPFQSIINRNSYNSFIFNSIPELVRLGDLIYLICAVIPFVSFRWLKMRSIDRYPLKIRIIIPAITLVLFIGVRFVVAQTRVNYIHSIGRDNYNITDAWNDMLFGQWNRVDAWRNSGLSFYAVNQFIALGDGLPISLSDAEKQQIENFINAPSSRQHHMALSDNKSKNLILIIVESLNANIIGRTVNGQEITPVLNSLIYNDESLSCIKVVSQIKDGCSSDGQMMYNTGLLPIKNGAAAMLFGSNKFKSLASESKKKAAIEIIAEQKSVWNHAVTSSGFGYQELIEKVTDKVEAETGKRHGHDASLFMYALKTMPRLQKPFLLEITTLSMHSPYKDPNASIAPFLSDLPDLPLQVANYYRVTNYFDTQLGIFLDNLKKSGIYDESVTVIVSDHNMALSGDEDSGKSPIVFVALNTGISGHIDYPVGQIDIFPTLLDLMGIDNPSWRGLGISLLNPENRSSVDVTGVLHGQSTPEIDGHKKEAWEISDLLIRSNYFE